MRSLGAVWGIDVGDSALKAVKLKRVGKQVALLDFHVIRYSDISGESGTRREGILPQAIAALQAAGLGPERCTVSISPQLVFNRFISLPPVDRRRIPEIVLYEARQQIPFNLNEVVWAYEALRKEFIPGEEIEIGLFAAKREVIDSYLGELAPLWKQLHAIQVGPLGLYNFVRHEVPLTRPTVVIDVGSQSTNLLILDGQRFWLRNLPIAGNSFTTILEKRLNIPRAEAEKLKYGVADSRHRRRILEVLRPVMRDLVAEIQRSVGYYKSLSQAVKFEEILVTGEGYKLFGLDRFIAEQLQYQIAPIQELKNCVYQGPPERAKDLGPAMPSLAVAIGLALQGLGLAQVTINLLPEDFIIRRELHAKRFTGFIAAALIWGIIGCFWAGEKTALGRMILVEGAGQKTLANVQALSTKLAVAEQGEDPKRLATYQDFGNHREYYARIIEGISAAIPREYEVDEFTITTARGFRGTAPAANAPAAKAPAAKAPAAARRGLAAARAAAAQPGESEEATSATDAERVRQSGILLRFTAMSPGTKEPTELTLELPKQLRKARIYPDGIEFIKGIFVERPNVVMRAASLGADFGGRGTRGTAASEPSTNYAADKWKAVVTIGLADPSEVDGLIKKAREDAAKEKAAQEAAAAAAGTAAPAGPAAPMPPAAPGQAP